MGRSAAPWVHLVALTALAVGLEFALAVGQAGPQGGWVEVLQLATELLPAVPTFVFDVLPVTAAVSIALTVGGEDEVAIRMTIASIGAMLVLDLVSPTVLAQTGERVALVEPSTAVADPVFAGGARVSASRMLVTFATGSLEGVHERTTRYTALNPRFLASFAFLKAGMLLLPVILVSLVHAVAHWIDRAIPRVEDARIAKMVAAWVMAPSVYWLLASWSFRMQTRTLFGEAPLQAILTPYVVFAPIAIVGAVSSARARTRGSWVSDRVSVP